jgi:hypothetical protein
LSRQLDGDESDGSWPELGAGFTVERFEEPATA